MTETALNCLATHKKEMKMEFDDELEQDDLDLDDDFDGDTSYSKAPLYDDDDYSFENDFEEEYEENE